MMRFLSSLFSLPVLMCLAALLTVALSDNYAALQLLDQQLFTLAGGAADSYAGANLQLPPWEPIANGISWLFGLGLWLLLLTRVNTSAAILISLLTLVCLVAVQLLAQQRFQLWLPQGLQIQFLIVSAPVVLLWSTVSRRWRRLRQQRDEALLELADIKLNAGQLDQARTHLERCHPARAVSELGYQLALRLEQKRSFAAATETYRWLAGFDPRYKDVAKKAKGVEIAPVTNSTNYLATQTLNIAEDAQRRPTLGRYRIEAELGRGAMGTVYLGIDPKISRQVAIKTLSYASYSGLELDTFKQRFLREAEAAGRLCHPNIVTVFDVGEEPDLCFIAMDYVEGNSLREHIDPRTLLKPGIVYQLMMQVADALDYSHQQQIVHRDIKPGNLLYNSQQQVVKVADFGIARIVDDSSTKTGDILGSPLYMSPEQLKGRKVTGASDIYSLGVTMYQLLTGQAPFSGDSFANLSYQVIHKKHRSVRELRPELPGSAARIINRAMAKEPEKRYANAAEMAEALRRALKKDFGID